MWNLGKTYYFCDISHWRHECPMAGPAGSLPYFPWNRNLNMFKYRGEKAYASGEAAFVSSRGGGWINRRHGSHATFHGTESFGDGRGVSPGWQDNTQSPGKSSIPLRSHWGGCFIFFISPLDWWGHRLGNHATRWAGRAKMKELTALRTKVFTENTTA